jgi:hypothetical protein
MTHRLSGGGGSFLLGTQKAMPLAAVLVIEGDKPWACMGLHKLCIMNIALSTNKNYIVDIVIDENYV